MHIVDTIAAVRAIRWAEPAVSWGLVPTMGALHEGHLALVRRARAENDRVSVSIFVNPLQFNQESDLRNYPRTLEHDLKMLEAEGVKLVWIPSASEMYPPGFQTYVQVEGVTARLEGAARPGHFRGVTTVVAKLFNIFQPTRGYFGQKDAQQVAVIQQMVRDLGFNLEVVVCPTVREADGLAMSSRNLRLQPAERQAATILYKALRAGESAWKGGQHDAEKLRNVMQAVVESEPLARIDYISVADPVSLEELEGAVGSALFSMAVYIGAIRLIDNITVGG